MGGKGTSDFRLRKCAKKEEYLVDRISQFPDDLLIYILSFLMLEDAARTSMLSKRWKDLWLSVDRLDFHVTKLWEGMQGIDNVSHNSNCNKYVKGVNKVILSHKATHLDMFRVRFHLDNSYSKDIDEWVQYAFARRVQRMDLNLLRRDGKFCGDSAYVFPRGLLELSNRNLAILSLPHSCGNDMISGALLGLKSLRTLTFRNVKVSREVLEIFLQCCPFLEYLAVEGSQCLEQLEVCGPSLALKHLEITACFQLRSLTVSDTNIVSLKVTKGHIMVLKNVPMLVDVFIGGCGGRNLVQKTTSWLSCCLTNLEILTLRIRDIQVRWEMANKVALPQLAKLKQLTFVAGASCDDSLIVFSPLIRACPNLEKFVLKLQWLECIDRICRKSEKALAFPLHHLKVVEICGYYGRTTEVELVEYFIENGVALERIIVDPRDQPMFGPCTDKPQEEEMARNLAKRQLHGLVPSHVELVIF